jgi:Cysteine-rich secretory protein family
MTGGRTLFATRRRNVWCWALSLASLTSVFSAASVAVPLAPASGQAAPVARLLDLINQDRAQHGLGAVSLSGPLSAIAQRQANAMAGARRIFQNPSFPGDVPAANSAGENVGYGPDVDTVHNAFVASPEHQVIIVGPDYRVVGIAVASSPIGLMVVENFVDTAGGAVAPPPPPPPPVQKPPPPPKPVVRVPSAAAVPVPAAPAKPVPAVPVAAPAPTPSPSPLPSPPAFDMALYTRMLQWDLWQTGTSSDH